MDYDVPHEVSRATVDIGGCLIEVVHLDNGQRIITADSMARFLSFLEGEDMKNVTAYEGEPRHETALRYIREREDRPVLGPFTAALSREGDVG